MRAVRAVLSQLKEDYWLKPNRTERPLISQPALHAESLAPAGARQVQWSLEKRQIPKRLTPLFLHQILEAFNAGQLFQYQRLSPGFLRNAG